MGEVTEELKEQMMLSTIISRVENHMGTISYGDIQRRFENISEEHHDGIEKCFHTRDTKSLGMLIMMAVYQDVQAEVTKELNNGQPSE